MDKIEELLTRGVDSIYPTKQDLEKVLRSGKKLTLYQGFDPTGTQLHIGHMIGLKKLRQWQDLGHHVIFLIGDGTGQAGDPSGKLTARDRFLTREELRKNATDYVKQAGKIMRFEGENPVEIRFNGDWLNKLTLVDILGILGHLSLQQLEERDLFEKRKKSGQSVNMREFIYPILQGYDSVAMEVDLELGGSDQMFNMLIGRQLLKGMKGKEKFVMTTPLLADSEGRKIGKTEGNVIALTDTPNDLYAKLLTLPDEVIIKGFEYLTTLPMKEIQTFAKALTQGENPMIYKKKLAFQITKELNSEQDAQKAQENFEKTVQQKELPTEIMEVMLDAGDDEMVNEDMLVTLNLASSKSEAKRLFQQNGVEVDGEKVSQPNKIAVKNGTIIKVGKRNIIKIKTA
jgi:tyrosyl-tRNA synthetase